MVGVPLVTQDDERVYYSTDAVPAGDDTTLRFVDRDAPTVPVVVQNQTGSGPLAPFLTDARTIIFLIVCRSDIAELTAPVVRAFAIEATFTGSAAAGMRTTITIAGATMLHIT